jgi:hypothetical protein
MVNLRKVLLSQADKKNEYVYGITLSQSHRDGECQVTTHSGKARCKLRSHSKKPSPFLYNAALQVDSLVELKIAQGYSVVEDISPTDGCMDLNSLALARLCDIDECLVELFFTDFTKHTVCPIPPGQRLMLELDVSLGTALAISEGGTQVTIPDHLIVDLHKALNTHTLQNCYLDVYLHNDDLYIKDVVAANNYYSRGEFSVRHMFLHDNFNVICGNSDKISILPIFSGEEAQDFIDNKGKLDSFNTVAICIMENKTPYIQGALPKQSSKCWLLPVLPTVSMYVTKVSNGLASLATNNGHKWEVVCKLPCHEHDVDLFDVVSVAIVHDKNSVIEISFIKNVTPGVCDTSCSSIEDQLGLIGLEPIEAEEAQLDEESKASSWMSW